MVCFDVIENLSVFAENRAALFPDFTSFIMAFFQNVLGSISTMVAIYTNIQSAATSGNLVPIFQQLGVAFRMLIDFQPLSDSPLTSSNVPQ